MHWWDLIRKWSVFFRFSRSTTPSTKPCSTRNSDVWNPSGSSCPIVCLITRGPAKPINAPGSAIITSPSIAKLAVTPPVVGSVNIVLYNSPASPCFLIAADVFAICISDTMPSCILAPPEQQNIKTGSFNSVARSMPLVIFSPTTWPILAIKKRESQIPMTASSPKILQRPIVTASFKPVFSLAAASFSSYPW